MNFDVVIVGGGLAGAALAVALRKSRLTVALIDAAAPRATTSWDARIYAYSPANAQFLRSIGVWERLDRSRLCPVHAMEIFGDGDGALNFSANDSGLAELAWIGESSLVLCELWESLQRQHNVTVLCPAVPSALNVADDGVELQLSDGRQVRARLLVGADGRDSWVRQQCGIAARVVDYEESALVANFRCERDHGNRAFQWFSERGIVAWLPLPERHMSLVWSLESGLAADLMALDDADFTERVAGAGQRRLGGLELVTPRAAFALRFMRVESVISPRVALIGDAAHAIHPLSGHGINLGFQDAKVLAERLLGMPQWEDPGARGLLRAYERARAEEPWLVQYVTHGLNRLFKTNNPLAAAARNFGLNLTDRLPVVRNALTRYAVAGKF